MALAAHPLQKAYGLSVILAVLLTLFLPLAAYALWDHYAAQPAWQRDGVRTVATITRMREKVIQKGHQMEVWVEHRPGGAGPTYRNWIDGGYVTRLTGTSAHPVRGALAVGDKLEILYRPGDPEGEAILPQDLEAAARVPFETPLFAGLLLGLWAGFVAMAFAIRRMAPRG